jgi:hypothetical protein
MGGRTSVTPMRLWGTRAVPLWALAILIVLKLGVVAIFGPTIVGDAMGYVEYGDAILSGAFLHVDLANDPGPMTLYRIIGYPAIIAGAKLVAGRDWAWTVVLFQFAVSICATVMVYRLARAFRLGIWLSLGVAAAQATSLQFVVDQAILSESLCASATTLAICVLSIIVLNRKQISLLQFAGVGALIVASFLIRDVMLYAAVGLAPLAVIAALAEHSRLRRVTALALVFVPLVVTYFAYIEWNRSRVGSAVITTNSAGPLLGALAEVARRDPAIFSGSTPIDEVGRLAVTMMEPDDMEYETPATVNASIILHYDYGWSAVRISHEVTLAFLRAWRDHPVTMIRHSLQAISEKQLQQAVRPTETVHDVLVWNTGSDYDFARERAVRAGNWWMIPAVIAHHLSETLSVLVFLAFLLVTPVRFVHEGLTPQARVSAGIWFVYFWVGGLYAAVRIEPRYLTPVVAGSIVVGVVNIVWLAEQYSRWRSRRSPTE